MVRHNWGEDRVNYLGSDERVRSIPRAWTDLASIDPFVGVAQGRASFGLHELLALCVLVRTLRTADQGGASG